MSEEPISHSTGTAPDEFVDTNAGEDAIMGTVADQPPEDPDNPSLDPGDGGEVAPGE